MAETLQQYISTLASYDEMHSEATGSVDWLFVVS